MSSAISIKNLTVAKGGTDILKDISIELPAGKIIGLLGPSGAGKTTLIRSIVGRQIIAKGEVTVLGQPAGSKSLRSQVGYMTQGMAAYPDLTVGENLSYFATMSGAPKSVIATTLQEIDMASKKKQLVSTLSGGEQSRVSLAIALITKAKLLVLDEPTVGVDPVLRQQLWSLFNALSADGCTLVISSHVMDEAERCDELVLIRDGQVLAQGTPGELRKQTNTKSVEDSFLKLVGEAA